MTGLITRLEEAADMKCPKCNARSGDDWEQCKGSCPMPGSPYFESQPQGQAMTDTVSASMKIAGAKAAEAFGVILSFEQTAAIYAAMLAASPQGEGSSADADTHRAAEGVVVAGEMEGESVALMRPFWVSWWGVPGTFELHRPWWVSGERDDRMQSICAAVLAPDEFCARLSVQWAMDDKEAVIEWRFCEPKERGWSPFGSRFRRADWMRWPDTVSTAEQVGMSEANAPYRVTEGVKP